ncbi:MAG: chorismate-binding protein, partial [candidate division Zixibacteria bacterium]|nr:chorismate-binding protein [candidate division Zixibacteria bacterium]
MITTFAEVSRLAKKGNVVAVSLRLSADLDTPVSTFLKLARGKKYSFLLESIEGGEKLARYSFVGFDPFLVIEINPASASVERKHGKGIREIYVRNGKKKKVILGQPIEFLEKEFSKYSPAPSLGIPRFSGGAVGYFGYDAIRWIENIPSTTKDNLHIPDCILGFYRSIVVFDHLRQELILVANVLCDEGDGTLREKYNTACEWLLKTRKQIDRNVKRQTAEPKTAARKHTLKTHARAGEFEKNVRRAKKYIREGDIFQVVLSQRWSLRAKVDPTALYRRLRRMNPSPYMFLLNFDDISVVGSSPEMLTRVEGDTVETRPIAGTRPRGKNPKEDEKLARELLADPKERAEHIMLLDLGRNDVGK